MISQGGQRGVIFCPGVGMKISTHLLSDSNFNYLRQINVTRVLHSPS
jgi:hypothetical protein